MSSLLMSSMESRSIDPMPLDDTRRCMSFLENESAASHAYQTIIDRLEPADGVCCRGVLRQFQEEHELAAEVFRQSAGGPTLPSNASVDAGVWEAALTRTGGIFQRSGSGGSVLQHLKQAELHTLEEYVDSLQHMSGPEAKFIREQLLPAQRRHVHMLRELLGERLDS